MGLSQITVYRGPVMSEGQELAATANKLSAVERAEILAASNSPEFLVLALPQVYARLLDAGIYLGSVCALYRVLEEI